MEITSAFKPRIANVAYLILCFSLVLVNYVGFAQQTDKQKDSLSVYIPVNIEDCMRQLDSVLSPESKEWIRSIDENEFLGRTHLTLGMWIRNNWGLWGNSHLAKYFSEQGIRHPDDMSGVILRSYYHYSKGEKVNYRYMLKKERLAEKRWIKQLEKEQGERQKDWEYEERYRCDCNDSVSAAEATSFLNLPYMADNLTGVQVYLRNQGDSITNDLLLMEQALMHNSRRLPRIDELIRDNIDIYYGRNPYGRVKKMKIKEDDRTRVFDFNPDGTLARYQFSLINNSKKRTVDEHYEYNQGHISQRTVYWNDTLHSVTLYRFSDPYHCQELFFSDSVWRKLEPGSDTVALARNSRIVLSPEGQPLAFFRPSGFQDFFVLFQYDSLGREVTWLECIDGCTVSHWSINIYDDERKVCYEYGRNWCESRVEATVFNDKGDVLGECCASLLDTFDYNKTLFSYRYDRYNNWIRMYEKGKLSSRCKIWYY